MAQQNGDAMLLRQLDSPEPSLRAQALNGLAKSTSPQHQEYEAVNMHIHSWYSYNACGYSPSHIAWLCRRQGLQAAGLCDFDVLDGLQEFLGAGGTLRLRVAVSLETRVFVPEKESAGINSPGEKGVAYIMAAGFVRVPARESLEARRLSSFRDQAAVRNRALVDRVNAHLPELALDYDRDVLRLAPAGNATERHIVKAYVRRAERVFADPAAREHFWTPVLGELCMEGYALEEQIRARLVKRGGLAYREPSAASFPPLDDFVNWTLCCGAIPMMAWLDGLSAGELEADSLLDFMLSKGVLAVNIIPERNWNIADKLLRKRKMAKLKEFVEACQARSLPINIGTEMNKPGLPFCDDLCCSALAPYRRAFMSGARLLIGHTCLLRYAGFSYSGSEAEAEFGVNLKAKNRFFESVGELPALSDRLKAELEWIGPQRAYRCLQDSARAGAWCLS